MKKWWHEFYLLYGHDELFKALVRGAEKGQIPSSDIDRIAEFLREVADADPPKTADSRRP